MFAGNGLLLSTQDIAKSVFYGPVEASQRHKSHDEPFLFLCVYTVWLLVDGNRIRRSSHFLIFLNVRHPVMCVTVVGIGMNKKPCCQTAQVGSKPSSPAVPCRKACSQQMDDSNSAADPIADHDEKGGRDRRTKPARVTPSHKQLSCIALLAAAVRVCRRYPPSQN